MAKVARGEGYSLLYRIGWRIQYALMHVYGPPDLDDELDPKVQMRRERARRQALWAQRQADKTRTRNQ